MKNVNLEILKHTFTPNELKTGDFGLEREGLRVDALGNLAQTPHPEIFGDKLKNPYIATDFSESQVEVVTPAYDTVEKTYAVLEGLCDIVNNEIGSEYFWPQSMPCNIPDDADIPIAQYAGEAGQKAMAYRKGLVERYGGKKQLISGIHFNFSFTENFIRKLHQAVDPTIDYKAYKNRVYLKLTRNYLRFRWLVIYLTGASNVMHKTYVSNCNKPLTQVDQDSYILTDGISIRNSSCGYKNKKPLFPRYDTVEYFTEDVRSFVKNGDISAPKELYSQVRMKANDVDNILESLEKDGIRYLEVRTLDLNPFDKCGVAAVDLVFLHQLMLFLLVEDEEDYADWQEEALENEEKVALQGLKPDLMLKKNGQDISLQRYALEVLMKMQIMDIELGLDNQETLKVITDRIIYPDHTYAGRIRDLVNKEGYLKAMLGIAKAYKEESYNTRWLLKGYSNYELSTQILIKEAMTRGVLVDEIDPQDNFIGLGKGDKKTYVKQATKTERDNYITVLAMENKVVTKKILKQQGIPVPAGEEFADMKNKHPFRGEGYTAPLKKIKLDEQTKLYLKQQNLTVNTVLPKGKTVYLRGNSNISTGGDSIDMTDVMPECFKAIAIKAAKAVKAVFCGVDIVIKDYIDPASSFGIIELNFNPSTDMHAYPYQGTERRTGAMILKALGLIESV